MQYLSLGVLRHVFGVRYAVSVLISRVSVWGPYPLSGFLPFQSHPSSLICGGGGVQAGMRIDILWIMNIFRGVHFRLTQSDASDLWFLQIKVGHVLSQQQKNKGFLGIFRNIYISVRNATVDIEMLF